jgi:hypothetical protein
MRDVSRVDAFSRQTARRDDFPGLALTSLDIRATRSWPSDSLARRSHRSQAPENVDLGRTAAFSNLLRFKQSFVKNVAQNLCQQ